MIEQAKRFDGFQLPPELARKFMLLRLSLTAPAPKDPALRKEMTQIGASLDADYGKGKYCRKPDDCLDITAIERIMGDSRDPNELKDLWVGWHKVGAPMRERYARFVQLSNQGAQELGLQRYGRTLALGLRHDSGAVQRRTGAAVAAGSSALSFSAHLRSRPAGAEIWAASRPA